MDTEIKPHDHPEAEAKGWSCGSCQWYTAGFHGKNCQSVRGVGLDTVACVEYIRPLDDPYQLIGQDKVIKEIRNHLKSKRFLIDISIIEELKSYVIGEEVTKSHFGSKQDVEGICEVLRRTVSYRARASTIHTTMIDLKHEYDELVAYAQSWLYSKYQLIRELRNEASRESVFGRLLPESIPIQKNLNKVLSIAKFIDEKLETTERTLSRILSSSEKLWFSREGWRGSHERT